MKIHPFKDKSRLQRVLDSVGDAPGEVRSSLPSSGKATKAGLITAGGLAGLTVASAGVSSLRRRAEGRRDDK